MDSDVTSEKIGAMQTVQGRYGSITYFTADLVLGRSLQIYGEWAENEIAFLRRFIQPGDTVLDLGANIGTHTLAFSQAVGDKGHVVAFEPRPEIFALLEGTVRNNKLTNVALRQAALGATEGNLNLPRLDVRVATNFGGLSLIDAMDGAATTPMSSSDMHNVRVITVDSLELTDCALIKLDVEGAEPAGLSGARRTIERLHPILYAECNSVGNALAIKTFYDEIGYCCFLHLSDAFNANNFFGAVQNIFADARETALLGYFPSKAITVPVIKTGGLLLPADSPDAIVFGLLQKPQFFHEALEFTTAGQSYKDATGRKGRPDDGEAQLSAALAAERDRAQEAVVLGQARERALRRTICELQEDICNGVARADELSAEREDLLRQLNGVLRRLLRPLKHFFYYLELKVLAVALRRLFPKTSQKIKRSATKYNPKRFGKLLKAKHPRDQDHVLRSRPSSVVDAPECVKNNVSLARNLFDSAWYKSQNPDLAPGEDLFQHFLRAGAKNGLDPSPYFKTSFYLEHNADVAKAGINPLIHFSEMGGMEGRSPHPLFDTRFYLETYPDVRAAGTNPLKHYLACGAAEGRRPNPNFDVDFYVSEHPEARANPLLHYIQFGVRCGWRTQKPVYFTDYLPCRGTQYIAPDDVVVDVVIPVYRGLDETRRCLEAVLADQDRPKGGIIVVDDCSPEPELSAWLESLADKRAIKLLKNPENLGFVRTVNRGMIEAQNNDVVLLNSDTEVATGWLRRMLAHAYAGDRIGSVTPYSNNATICSYPSFQGGPLPNGYTLSEIDNACRSANGTRSVDLPTAVGFCMYIRRDCLMEVGLFDQEAFGRGYGEENDFCMRATARGWRHVLACDTFVFHAGEVSFGRNSPERIKAWDILTGRYPAYSTLVGNHTTIDPGAGYRFAITVALFRASARPTILMATHNWGGGTERHVQELASTTSALVNVVVLHASDDSVVLSIPALPGHPVLTIPSDNREILLQVLRAFEIARVHVQHWLDEKYGLQALIDELRVPFDVTIHDYFVICPQINLVSNPGHRYCEEPGVSSCDSCIAQSPRFRASSIIEWRAKHAWLMYEAERLICPSQDVKNRIAKYYSRNNAIIVPHEPIASDQWSVFSPLLAPSERLRVALIGILASHKGRDAVEACLKESHNRAIDFLLIGAARPAFAPEIAANFKETGIYEEADLSDKIAELAPHVVWFPQTWPETYSYTLSAAIEAKLPIVASKLGAFPERLAGRPFTWLQDNPACSASEWLAIFDDVRTRLPTERKGAMIGERAASAPFYPDNYVKPIEQDYKAKKGKLIDLRRRGRRTALVMPDRLKNGNISPCGFIRLVLPLDHLANSNGTLTVEHVSVDAALRRIGDLLICQRHFVSDIALAEKLITHCRLTGMLLVYDLDDDLITSATEHPENNELQRLAPVVIRMLIDADKVWVSTEELRQRISGIRPNAIVLPNRLDERLWVENGLQTRPQNGPVRILYMGIATHDIDLAFFEEIVDRLSLKFGSGVTFEVIRVTAKEHLHPSMTRLLPPETASASYPGFVEWIVRQSRWDIGVAPLVDTVFARAKSGIKVLDYAALGLAVVASDVQAYRGMLSERDGVKLVPNDADAWVAALSELIQDHEKCQELGRRAREAFLRTNSLAIAGKQWEVALDQALGGAARQ